MNRSTGIPAAVIAFGSALIYALGKTILENEEVISLLAVVAGMAAVAIAFTWGYVEWWKRGEFSPATLQTIGKPYRGKGLDPFALERNLVYNRAVASGFVSNLCTGVLFLLLENATIKELIVLGVGWVIWSAVIGFVTPWLWRIVFYHCRPKKQTEDDVESKL